MESVIRVLGKLFYNVRSGDAKLLTKVLKVDQIIPQIEISSSLFKNDGYMPIETAGVGVGDNKSPPLTIHFENDIRIKSYVIVVQDIDPPLPSPITHLLAYNISPETTTFELNEFDGSKSDKFILGISFRGRKGYCGPRPVIGHGDHRYVFQVYAINEDATSKLEDQNEDLTTERLVQIIEGNIIKYGTLTGLYKRD
ncbi:phosphatidylethanolamine-binding protein [Scheffersomyces amazonensis]|uniref:phosphatidylethanolamine-binding protein n=1 Tax=Scheffersomyces amazonensis TaxID=1078765 RepID=UPI00315C8BCD